LTLESKNCLLLALPEIDGLTAQWAETEYLDLRRELRQIFRKCEKRGGRHKE